LIKEALALPVGQQVTLGGWVRTVRSSKGGFSFIALYDGSCFGTIQIVADGKLSNYESDVVKLGTGSSLWVSGTLVASQGKGQKVELQASEIRVLGKADPDAYPIQQKQTTFEFLRTQAHLRARTNTFGAVARVRNVICWAIHQFFQERGFVYLHTPIVTASDCEGAGQMFRVSTLDFENPPRNPEGKIDYSQDFFGKSTYLTVSGQLEGETYACALGNIYTFGPTFRAENSNTPRHLAEFWMIEPEMAFCDLAGDADLAEAFLKHIFKTVLEKCPDDMAFFNERIDKTVIETLTHIADSGFERLTYTDAVELLKKSGKTWEFPVDWGTDLQTEHERYLTEQVFKKPVILMDYPAKIKAFYMRLNDDAAQHAGQPTVAAMDVLVPKIGEIIGGSQREERLDMLEKRMVESGLKKEDYWWYLDLRRFGSVPHAGFGLGLERVIQFCTGMANIRDVIPYPRAPRSAEF
jgi:asparaginyl-tRNA synthetase